MSNKFSVVERLKSFRFAFSGLVTLVVDQHNARVHLVATVFVVLLGCYVDLAVGDWIILILTMSIVWLGESLNSAVEYLSDAVVPEQHPLIKKAKDVAAAGVLVAAIGALVIGLLIFVPYFS